MKKIALFLAIIMLLAILPGCEILFPGNGKDPVERELLFDKNFEQGIKIPGGNTAMRKARSHFGPLVSIVIFPLREKITIHRKTIFLWATSFLKSPHMELQDRMEIISL